MPKVTGPLFSLRASGTLNGSLTYASTLERNIVRARVTPHDPMTPAQIAQRTKVATIAASWLALDNTTRAAWQTAGAAEQQNGYSYFVQQYHAQDSSPEFPPSLP